MMRPWIAFALVVGVISLIVFLDQAGLATAASHIVVDGAFDDWSGRANLSDPQGDAAQVRNDLAGFYWANNDEEYNYWMIERHDDGEGGDQSNPVNYTIYVDTDDDGDFNQNEDRRVLVNYNPGQGDSNVTVRVKRGKGGAVISNVSGDWGDSISEGGQRVELRASWSDLGIGFGSTIRMYVESSDDETIPDSGDIQWSVASILGYPILGALLIGGSGAFWWVRRRREMSCPSG